MNEQAQKILVDLLQKASNGIDSAVSFSQAQIPDVVHQLLVWNFTSSMISTIIGFLLFLGAQCASWLIFKKLKNDWAGDEFFEHPESMIVGMIYAFTYLPLALTNMDWLKIWLAPKLYLIEYAASLVK